MEIYSLYRVVLFAVALIGGGGYIASSAMLPSLALAGGIWLILFVLQGVGLYKMAQNAGLKHKWLAFVPFADIFYIGKLTGTCSFFGHKMKRGGLYAMLAQIFAVIVFGLIVAAEILLVTTYGGYRTQDASGNIIWSGLSGFGLYTYRFYVISDYLGSIVELAYTIFILVLLMGFYKRYTPRNFFILSFLSVFVPCSRFIVTFVLRNNKRIDYEAYMRAQREAFLRSRQQQNPYGGNPYGGNPYGNPPYGGNPYGNNPYGGMGGNSTPTGQNAGQNAPGASGGATPEDPFAEFAPGSSSPRGENASAGQEKNGDGTDGGKTGGSDDLFD